MTRWSAPRTVFAMQVATNQSVGATPDGVVSSMVSVAALGGVGSAFVSVVARGLLLGLVIIGLLIIPGCGQLT